ncbi:MAG: hypothetical protein HQK83_08525 [Fibrobacteria bacterium]|nr:hypothetical protein [Fibrobacteria bacterium]
MKPLLQRGKFVACVIWLMTGVAYSLSIDVSNFRNGLSGSADTSHLASGWGSSLEVAINYYDLLPVLQPVTLNKGILNNGLSGANPVVVNSDGQTFKIAYTSWYDAHNLFNNSQPQASIVIRTLSLESDTVVFSDSAFIVAQSENPSDKTGYFYGNTPAFVPPPPTYMNFAAEGDGFAAYWTTLTPNGPIRRSSDNDIAGKTDASSFGVYVPTPGNWELLTDYYGTLGMAAQPGSNADKLVLAYEYKIGPAQIRLRWENLGDRTSKVATITRTAFAAVDFAVAASSNGNVLAVWREDSLLWGVGYNNSQVQIMAPKQLDTEQIYFQTIIGGHTYRQYGIAPLSNTEFVVTYGKGDVIYYSIVNVSNGGITTAESLTPATKQCYFPDVAVSTEYVVFSWYGNMYGGNRQIECAWFSRTGATIDTDSRQDKYLTGENVSFNVGNNWQAWHNYRVPNIAVDEQGDFAVAYDNGFDAKAAAWRNTPMYFSTAYFLSDSIVLGDNGSSYSLDPAVDSVAITSVRLTPDDQGEVLLSFGAGGSYSSFSQVIDTGALASPLKGNFNRLKYRVNLETESLSLKSTPSVSALSIDYNIKPHTAVVETLQLGTSGAVQIYDPANNYNLVARQDTLRLIAWAFDVDNDVGFRILTTDSAAQDNSPESKGAGFYRSVLSVPPLEVVKQNHQVEIITIDGEGWTSEAVTLRVNYFNYPPVPSVSFQKNRYPKSAEKDTIPLYERMRVLLRARDTAAVIVQFNDGNDTESRVQFFSGDVQLYDSVVSAGVPLVIPFTASLADTGVQHRILFSDQDTTVEFEFVADYANDVPVMTSNFIKHQGAEVDRIYVPNGGGSDTLAITSDEVFVVHVDDTARVFLECTDSVDNALELKVYRQSNLILDSTVIVGEPFEFIVQSDSTEDTSVVVISLSDPDTTISARFMLLPNQTPILRSMYSILDGRVRDSISGVFGDTAIAISPLQTDSLVISYGHGGPVGGGFPHVSWRVLSRPEDCAIQELSCYEEDTVLWGDTAVFVYNVDQEKLIIQIKDVYSAFFRDTITLYYPFLDTSTAKNEELREELLALESDTAYVLGSTASGRLDTISFLNSGSAMLQIDSIKTGVDNGDWLHITLSWTTPENEFRKLKIDEATDAYQLTSPLNIAPESKITLGFLFFSDSLKGDSVIQDTLFLATSDFNNPVLKLPFKFRYIDLPILSLSVDTTGRFSPLLKTVASILPPVKRQTSIIFSFSEPVRLSTVLPGTISIYSYLDSLKTGGIIPIASAYPDYLHKIYYRSLSGQLSGSLVDTLIFSPHYTSPGDSLGVQPRPGAFLPRDIIRIQVSNSITDSVGNALDLGLRKIAAIPGSQDSLFTLSVDTSRLSVVSTVPANHSISFDPEDPIEIRFNRPVAYTYEHDTAGVIVSVDTVNLLSDSNLTVNVSSAFHGTYHLRYLRLTNNGRTLLIRTSPNIFSVDSVTVYLHSRIGSVDGFTLDGNGDGIGSYWFDFDPDSSDVFSFGFKTRRKEFYIYPNPFNWSKESHAESECGCMTFKNVRDIKGVETGQTLIFRIYTISGDLVFSSDRRVQNLKLLQGDTEPAWKWDLTNNYSKKVATGMYIYSISVKSKGLVKKGKLAVIR